MSEVSVVVPTLDAGELFEEVLDAIRRQRGVGEVDLVVVDSSSTDDTVARSRRFGARVHVIDRRDFNHGLTRNLGAAIARGRHVAFLTQDATPADEDWLRAMVEALRSEGACGAYSRVLPRPDCTPLVRRAVEGDLVFSTEREVKRAGAEEIEAMDPFQRRIFFHFNNVSSMVDREHFARCPFPRIPFGEDLAWGGRILRDGGALVYEPASVVLHSHESALGGDRLRHRQDARLMRTLFGYRVREGWRDSLPAWRGEVQRDREFLRRQGAPFLARLGWRLRSELLRGFQILGQYQGSGLPVDPPEFPDGLPAAPDGV